MPSSRWLKAVPSQKSPEESKPAATPNVSMSDLRRLEREKRERSLPPEIQEPAEPNIPDPGIPSQGIPATGRPPQSIPNRGIPINNTLKTSKTASVTRGEVVSPAVSASAERGFYPTFNDLDDHVVPGFELDPYEQSVLRRLYRLSRGFKSLECEVGLGALSKACNIARSKVQQTIASLVSKGLVRPLGHSQAGTKYRVLEQFPAIPGRGIPQGGIPLEREGIPQTEFRGIPQGGNIKYNKELINTHTNTVGVGSKFSIEECRRYADHLRASGQGINNPGGYATTIHRTGEADELIERFLNPAGPETSMDALACPDCHGSGFYYPKGTDGGVAKCRHEKLAAGT